MLASSAIQFREVVVVSWFENRVSGCRCGTVHRQIFARVLVTQVLTCHVQLQGHSFADCADICQVCVAQWLLLKTTWASQTQVRAHVKVSPQLISSCVSGSSDLYSSNVLQFNIDLTVSADFKPNGELCIVLAQEAWETSAVQLISSSV